GHHRRPMAVGHPFGTSRERASLQGTSLGALAQRAKVILLPGPPRRARAPRQSHSPLRLGVPPRSSPSLPSALRHTSFVTRVPFSPLRRRRVCRRNAPRRLLDPPHPQLARLPPQRLALPLLHLGLVLLLTPAHVRHPVLQRQVDDPRQLVRRR